LIIPATDGVETTVHRRDFLAAELGAVVLIQKGKYSYLPRLNGQTRDAPQLPGIDDDCDDLGCRDPEISPNPPSRVGQAARPAKKVVGAAADRIEFNPLPNDVAGRNSFRLAGSISEGSI